MNRGSAEATREMAFNQGFYNLFLAVESIIGVAVYFLTSPVVGLTLALFGTGSMLAAAFVLLVTSPDKRSAAIEQGLFPFVAVAALGVAVLL